ncbi:MAG: hypothetical protein J7J70_06645 [Deltaproteobacteria bacterium]|nr:hypothetical protein [Candidatus Tharpellaceae bacterium]
MNWLSTSLNNINDDLRILEADKKLEQISTEKHNKKNILTRDLFTGTVEQSKVWSLTLKEKTAMEKMSRKLSGYKSVSITQASVLSFLNAAYYKHLKHKKLAKMTNVSASDSINKYIKASVYWTKKSTNIIREYGKEVKWVFAVNEEMQAVICRYREWFIVTSISSHENIMREIEGKAPNYPVQWDEPIQLN